MTWTSEAIDHLLGVPREHERLEFKEAKQQFDTTKLLRYCVALANEGGGLLVLGVSDRPPRRVVGTQAFAQTGAIKARIVDALRIRVDVEEVAHPDGRVLVFEVPSRPAGTALSYEGAYLMRAGEELKPMTEPTFRTSLNHLQNKFFHTAPPVILAGASGIHSYEESRSACVQQPVHEYPKKIEIPSGP